ncbi:MAG: 30S ribosomal protein S20 [Alphaproteobacteria bacterium]|nr:30S ribosomal protein S20 [Alphaproteobacteria bacterium]
MANHKSAKTRIRRNDKRSMINGMRRSRVRTFVKKVDALIAAGNKDEAVSALRIAESEMMRAAQKGVFHKNTASRTISRLAQKIKAL